MCTCQNIRWSVGHRWQDLTMLNNYCFEIGKKFTKTNCYDQPNLALNLRNWSAGKGKLKWLNKFVI